MSLVDGIVKIQVAGTSKEPWPHGCTSNLKLEMMI